MTDKQIINTCEFFNICKSACGGTLEDTEMCSCYELYKQLKQKEQEYKELKEQYKKVEDMMIKSGANMCGELQNLYRALDEIEINILKYQGLTFGKPRTMRENDCIYKILDIINKLKED